MPVPSADALQNTSASAKAALDSGVIKADAATKALLWSQIAQVDAFVAELRAATPPADAPPVG